MDRTEGADGTRGVRPGIKRQVRFEFRDRKISPDRGLLFRQMDEVLGTHDIAAGF